MSGLSGFCLMWSGFFTHAKTIYIVGGNGMELWSSNEFMKKKGVNAATTEAGMNPTSKITNCLHASRVLSP